MDRDAQTTLRWVNAQRAVRDLPLLDRLPRWRGCIDPLEQAFLPIRCRVSHDQVWLALPPGRVVITLPAGVQAFLRKCDLGFYDDFLAPVGDTCPRELHLARCAHSVTRRLRAV